MAFLFAFRCGDALYLTLPMREARPNKKGEQAKCEHIEDNRQERPPSQPSLMATSSGRAI
jgi:hypothetical protein